MKRVITIAVSVLALTACGGGSQHGSSPPTPSDPAASFRADVAAYNSGGYAPVAATLGYLGQIDCAVGDEEDFPGTTLITVISSSGNWWQFEYKDGQGGLPLKGANYMADLPSDWQTFKATSGVNCSIAPDGTITIN